MTACEWLLKSPLAAKRRMGMRIARRHDVVEDLNAANHRIVRFAFAISVPAVVVAVLHAHNSFQLFLMRCLLNVLTTTV